MTDKPSLVTDYAPAAERERLANLEKTITKQPSAFEAHRYAERLSPVDEIAGRIVKLTYGELKELAAGIAADPDKIWQWALEDNNDAGKGGLQK